MKILLTGSTSFIGGYLTKRLQDKHELISLKSRLEDFEAVQVEVQTIKPEIIIHLAAKTEVEKSFYDPINFSVINYCGTVNLIEASKDLGLKLFLFASTMETYGEVYTKDQVLNHPEELKPFTEHTKQHPNAPYSVAKKGCELYLQYAKRAYDFPFVALRQTNSYGRHDNDFFVVEQIITQMLKNPKEINLGYGEPWRNFLYIDDLLDFYELVIDNYQKVRGQFFVLGPDNALQIKDLVKLIAKKLKWKGQVNWDKKPVRVGEIYYLNSIPTKAKNMLGWEPKVSLSEGLDRTIALWKR